MQTLVRVMAVVLGVLAVAGVAEADGVFVATLSGTEEVPPVATEMGGRARIVFDEADTSAKFFLQIRNGVRVTQAHLHCAPRGENGPVVVWLAGLHDRGWDVDGLFPWISNAVVTDENITNPACGVTLAELVASIRAGLVYVNVHTIAYPGGEVRGQLTPR